MGGVIHNLSLIIFHFYSPHLFPTINAKLLPNTHEDGGIDPTEIPVYIVHVKKPQGDSNRSLRVRDLKNWYTSFLPNTTLASGEPRMIYTYREVITGFAARLTPEEVKAMESLDGLIKAYPEKEYYTSTTYSPTFLGLKGNPSNTLWYDSSMGAGQIIGVIDSGIDRNHPSFSDDGMPPVPAKWNGKCYWGNTSTCNNKLLGAIAFFRGRYSDPHDNLGHGTHVASIAAGNFVNNASVMGQAQGTASGTAPRAHFAMYKPGSSGHTALKDSDIYMCIEQALRDHVDILQMSLGVLNRELYHSAIAIGSFAAIKKGIFPCAAIGNKGPTPSRLINDAPWILSIGASTVDRKIVASVLLGNGLELIGESGYQSRSFPSTQMPLVYPGYHLRTPESLACSLTELNKLNLQNKIVMCFRLDISDEERAENVLKSGGKAMILLNKRENGQTTFALVNKLPILNLNSTGSSILGKYYQKTLNTTTPTATIYFGGTQFGMNSAPAVASFSSRGPSLKNGGIIKPDVIAPGVNILGAWPQQVGPTRSIFNFLSGTSMATPQVSGVVALLRNKYPNWSPAAIKSAIMTTAYTLNRQGNPIVDEHEGNAATVLEQGAGHIDPEAATKPGIIYDIHYYDYVHYLCEIYKSHLLVEEIIKASVNCSQVKVITPEQLNYPSFGVSIGGNTPLVMVNRTVTNVGDAKSTYNVDIKEPEGVRVDVTPKTLQFNQLGEKRSYEVKFSLKGGLPAPAAGEVKDGRLSWDSGKYYASSPIVVTFI